MDTATLNRRLRMLRERYPELGPIIDRLGRGLTPTRAFVSAYLASDVAADIRGRLMRTVLPDPALYPECARSEPDLATYRRTAVYLHEHPMAPQDWRQCGFDRLNLPRHLARLFGLTEALGAHPRLSRFVEHFALAPYERYQRSGQACLPDGRALPAGTSLAFLAPFYEARRPRVDEVISALGRTGPGLQYERLLPACAPALAARNAITLTAAALTPVEGGRERQNHIPRPLTRSLGLRDLSVPQLLLFADIFTLADTGVLDIQAVRPKHDFMGLRALLPQWRAGVSPSERQALLKALGQGHLLDPAGAIRLDPREPGDARRGVYDSAVHCNLQRLLARVPDQATGLDFRPFARYYEAVSPPRLLQRVLNHYRGVDGQYARWLGQRIAAYPAHFAGIHLRDMANSLFLVHEAQHRGDSVYFALPAVARFALGQREHPRRARPAQPGRQRSRRAPEDRVSYPLPILEDLLGPVQAHPAPAAPRPGGR